MALDGALTLKWVATAALTGMELLVPVMEVVTVSVNGEPHDVSGTGAHFALSVKGTSYTVYVLHVDSQAKSVRLRIAESP